MKKKLTITHTEWENLDDESREDLKDIYHTIVLIPDKKHVEELSVIFDAIESLNIPVDQNDDDLND